MKKGIIGSIFFMMLFITTAVSPVIGMINKNININSIIIQSKGVEWAKTYGGSEFDMFHCIHQTLDEGYIVSGVTEVSNSYFPLLMKLDSIGEEEWSWTISEITFDGTAYDILDVYPIFCNQISDGGYLFCLWLDVNYEETLRTIAGLFEFNENGELEWFEIYSEGFGWGFRPISFIEIDDGYVVTGISGDSSSYMGDDAFLLKTDKSGKELWIKEYKYGDYDDRMEAVCRTDDNGYILTGWRKDTSYNYWMIKTDEYGNEQWNKSYGGSGDDFCHTKDCYQTSEGDFIMCGFTNSFGEGGFDVWVVKTDSIGNMLWNKTYGGTKNDVCWSIESTDDSGYVLIATMNYGGFFGDKDDIHLVKIDNNGNIVWVQEYAGSGIQIGTSVDKTTDGGFIISGCTGSFHSSKSDGLIVKFAPFENQRPNKPDIPSGPIKGKPDIEYTFSASTSDPDGDNIYYKWDWGDGNYSDWLGPYNSGNECEASYTWQQEANFLIKVIAKDDKGGESSWSEELKFSTPKNREINRSFLNFQKQHPILYQLLKPFFQI